MNDEGVRPVLAHDPPRLAVLISGGGSGLVNLAERIDAGELDAKITAVVASNERAGGIERARAMNLPTFVIPRSSYESVEAFSEAVFTHIREAEADLVCLAGFLSLLAIPADYTHQVLNVHPALLPAFGGQGMYGRHVHEAVLAMGCKVSGCTIHFADQAYDRGPILIQQPCPVLEDDTPQTLADRVQEQERNAYPEAIRLIAAARVRIAHGRTWITGHSKP